ncbi:hypothetical protein EBB07_15985 [Paenibacillaceae bacterium]|nr:hypothetical protein EBB07_15985 [Paenibacillaceae bacterium]
MESNYDGRPDEYSGPQEWLTWFDAKYGLSWQQCRQSIHPLQAVLLEMKGTAKLWPKPLQRLHWLHAVTFVFDQVETAFAATDAYNRYYYEMSFSRMTEPWISHFLELAAGIKTGSWSALEQEWMQSLVKLLRERAGDAQPSLLGWDRLYHAIWGTLLDNKDQLAVERIKLSAMLESLTADNRAYSFVQGALANLDVVAMNEESAVERLAAANYDSVSWLAYSFAERSLEQRRWQPFRAWMNYLQNELAECRNSVILRPFLTLCRKADLHSDEDWGERMIAFLPHSYEELASHWLAAGHYVRWADLLLYLGVRIETLTIQDLREAGKAAPRVLIPIYHQAVDDAILARNRQGYRLAVKLLKKLEKLYEAEKLAAQWGSYIKQFAQKHQRLRALQEELWKGNYVK